MPLPYYVSPEQMMKDKAEYARKGISRGKAIVAIEYRDQGHHLRGVRYRYALKAAERSQLGLGVGIGLLPFKFEIDALASVNSNEVTRSGETMKVAPTPLPQMPAELKALFEPAPQPAGKAS